ncbi:MAG: PHB depolymerase family esterase [Pseudomonadota bacterium]|nr:PHB depolymerase family esterase [Pseudomonadota bacterium]
MKRKPRLFRYAACLSVAAATLVSQSPAQAGLLSDLYGKTVSTAVNVTTAVLDPISGLLSRTVEGLNRTLIRIQGRYLVLAAGTEGFEEYIEHDGLARRFVIVRPEDGADGAPVLLLLHGNSGTAENMSNLTEASAYVATRGIWAVMPEAVDGVWNEDPADSSGIDDVGFISALIQHLVDDYDVDADRIYVAGLSNGGTMTQRLACEMPDRIAAFAAVAATLRNSQADACPASARRPIAYFRGTADPLVPYGSIGTVRSATEVAEFWAQQLGCSEIYKTDAFLADTTNDGTTVELLRYPVCASGGEVRLYTINNGGHAWPGGWQYLPVPVIGTTSTDIDATEEIVNFALNYSL